MQLVDVRSNVFLYVSPFDKLRVRLKLLNQIYDLKKRKNLPFISIGNMIHFDSLSLSVDEKLLDNNLGPSQP